MMQARNESARQLPGAPPDRGERLHGSGLVQFRGRGQMGVIGGVSQMAHLPGSLPMMLVPTGAALVGAVLPYTGLAGLLGFTPLPASFFLLLAGLVLVYLLLVEVAKARFYRVRGVAPPPPPTRAERLERRLRRRAGRFIHRPAHEHS
jgi:hypothetical protein